MSNPTISAPVVPSLLIVGATGLVGREVLEATRLDPRITRVVAPTRRPLEGALKVDNPIVEDFGVLPEAAWWGVDAVVCALGTTRKQAGSAEAFRKVDFDIVLAVARKAHAHGAKTFVLTSSVGANAKSHFLYLRTKGEIEDAIAAIGFASYTVVRPAGLVGERSEKRRMEGFANGMTRAVSVLVPRRYRPVHASAVAATLLQAAISAPAGRHVIESERIARS